VQTLLDAGRLVSACPFARLGLWCRRGQFTWLLASPARQAAMARRAIGAHLRVLGLCLVRPTTPTAKTISACGEEGVEGSVLGSSVRFSKRRAVLAAHDLLHDRRRRSFAGPSDDGRAYRTCSAESAATALVLLRGVRFVCARAVPTPRVSDVSPRSACVRRTITRRSTLGTADCGRPPMRAAAQSPRTLAPTEPR